MSRLCLIAIFSVLIANSAFAQQPSVDTLYTGLKKATSFTFGNDAIYIVEAGAHRVLKLGFDGKLIEKYGKRGSGNYQFDNPLDIATTNGLKLFVSDSGNNRIQVFDKRWQYLSSIKAKEQFQTRSEITPMFLGVNKFGEVIFYNESSGSLGKYNEDGAMLDQIPLPSEVISVDGIQISGDKVFILDRKSGFIHRLSGNGFYETFYPAKRGNTFYYKDEIVYLIQGYSLKSYAKGQIRNLYDFKSETLVTKIMVIDDDIFILTSNSLLKISL
ncbi:MAG: hypothetical protein ABJ387_04050 [Balneola sp.]